MSPVTPARTVERFFYQAGKPIHAGTSIRAPGSVIYPCAPLLSAGGVELQSRDSPSIQTGLTAVTITPRIGNVSVSSRINDGPGNGIVF
jgi:hypothetical protein